MDNQTYMTPLGDATYAAITAVVIANTVLVAYIISSLLEDKQQQKETSPPEIKKMQ